MKTFYIKAKILFCYVLLLSLGMQVIAQSAPDAGEYQHHSYQAAIKDYLKKVKKHPDDGELLFNLANSYRLNGQYVEAEPWFARAVKHSDKAAARLYYAQVLLINGRYDLASDWFLKYAAVAENIGDVENAKQLSLESKRLFNEGIVHQKCIVRKLPFNSEQLDFSPTIWKNGRLIFASNRTGVVSEKSSQDAWTGDNFVDLWVVDFMSTGSYGTPQRLNKSLNSRYHEGSVAITQDGNKMYLTRSDVLKKKRGFDDKQNTRLKIFEADWDGSSWIIGKQLPFCSSEYTVCHPALSTDGNTMVFSSDRSGGYGGMDLYVVKKSGVTWSEPQNLGRNINTAGNEVFPALDANDELYFSSDLQVGIGGLDVFRSEKEGANWGIPHNIGAPINSARDDFGIAFLENSSKGFFTSNRGGKDDDIYSFEKEEPLLVRVRVLDCSTQMPISGIAVVVTGSKEDVLYSDENGYIEFPANSNSAFDFQATGKDYLFSADCPGSGSVHANAHGKFDEIVLPITKDCPSGNCSPLAAKPMVFGGQIQDRILGTPISNVSLQLIDRATGKSKTIFSEPDGKFRLLLPEKPLSDYWLVAKKPGYLHRNIPLNIKGKKLDDVLDFQLPLENGAQASLADGDRLPLINPFPELDTNSPEGNRPVGMVDADIAAGAVIELYNIYFDYDQFYIRRDAFSDLNYVLDLMERYPTMRGEIAAHTDSRASFEYNATLSTNRANAARDWLVKRGVDPSRISARGYGELQLLNGCKDGVECDEKEHQRNRRVEFRVTFLDETLQSKEYDYFKGRK